MTALDDWAVRHTVTPDALADLRRVLVGEGVDAPLPPATVASSEAYVQSAVRLEAAQLGVHLFRNNVGVAEHPETGRPVRYGLANDSAQMNARLKSSDLIGIRPVVVTVAHVGQTIGQFVARECKATGWQGPRGDREEAQARFLALITAAGGDAAFADREGTL